jgi:hypothetical protein
MPAHQISKAMSEIGTIDLAGVLCRRRDLFIAV